MIAFQDNNLIEKNPHSHHSASAVNGLSTWLAAVWIVVLAMASSATAQVTYSLDDGSAELSVIVIAGTEPRPTLWLNAFDAQPGGEVITSISVTWGNTAGGSSGVPEQAPTTVLLYQDDPSNDGDPRTATLLVSHVLDNGAPLGSIDTGVFLDVPIPPTTVNGTFFVAALYPDPGKGHPAPVDTTDPDHLGRSWVFSSAENAVNVDDLGHPVNFGGLIEAAPFNLPGNWLLRATGEPRPGDLDGDGVVGILDLLSLLSAWGPCPDPPAPCPADLDGDGAVGILDLLALLANWGP